MLCVVMYSNIQCSIFLTICILENSRMHNTSTRDKLVHTVLNKVC